jgi:hypothetical protein
MRLEERGFGVQGSCRVVFYLFFSEILTVFLIFSSLKVEAHSFLFSEEPWKLSQPSVTPGG